MRWGLVPSFTKPEDKPDHWRMFNARSETVPGKGVFSRLLARQRCVVLLNGFFEWAKVGKTKQPYYIYRSREQHAKAEAGSEGPASKAEGASQPGEADEAPYIMMAGLFDVWRRAGQEEPVYTYTILTTDSSSRIQWLHDRMPVVLPTEVEAQAWLAPKDEFEQQNYAKLTLPYNGEDLHWHPVTTAMSSPAFQSPDACKEVKKPSAASFFQPRRAAAAAKPDRVTREAVATKSEGDEPSDVARVSMPAAAERPLEDSSAQPSSAAPGTAEASYAGAADRRAAEPAASAGPPEHGSGAGHADMAAAPDTQHAAKVESEPAAAAPGSEGPGKHEDSHTSTPGKRPRQAAAASPAKSPAAKRAKQTPPASGKGTITAFFAKKDPAVNTQ